MTDTDNPVTSSAEVRVLIPRLRLITAPHVVHTRRRPGDPVSGYALAALTAYQAAPRITWRRGPLVWRENFAVLTMIVVGIAGMAASAAAAWFVPDAILAAVATLALMAVGAVTAVQLVPVGWTVPGQPGGVDDGV